MNFTFSFRFTLIFTCLFYGIHSKITRNVKVHRYRCPCKQDYNILHVKATQAGSNDTVHYLWSAIGLPAVVVGHNSVPGTLLDIDWKNGSYKDMTIKFVPAISEVSAMVFKDITEYEDKKDDQNADANIIGNIMKNFTWNFVSSHNLTDGASASFRASSSSSNSFLTLDLKAFSKEGYDTEPPREPVNANSVRFAFGLDNLPTTTKNSRFSIGVAFVKKSQTKPPSFTTEKSIDDERTPGIFKLMKMKLPTNGESDSFASWKPVSYTQKEKDHKHQSFLHNFPKGGDKGQGTLSIFNGNIGYSIADAVIKKGDLYLAKVSFGQQKDNFYDGVKYRVWIGLFGHGSAPGQSLSTKMYLILFLGLGIPLAFTVLGTFVIFFKKIRRRQKSSYERIN